MSKVDVSTVVVSPVLHMLTQFLATGPLHWHFSSGLKIVDWRRRMWQVPRRVLTFRLLIETLSPPPPPVLYSEKPEVDLRVISRV